MAVFADEELVLLKNIATVQERIDLLAERGVPEASVKAALAECAIEPVSYRRDKWGRIIALNSVEYSPHDKPPPFDAFGARPDGPIVRPLPGRTY